MGRNARAGGHRPYRVSPRWDGGALERHLADTGYTHQQHGDPPTGTNSVLVASRLPMSVKRLHTPHHRLVAVAIDGLSITGVYLPLRKRNVAFWISHFQPALDELRAGLSVVIGDFNTGDDRDREARQPFFAEHLFKANVEGNWVDAWRAMHPERRESSCRSNRGNGFLIDHVWLSQAVRETLRSAIICHGIRDAGPSDHAALTVDLAT